MTKHRVLSIKKLVATVPWELFSEYFEKLAPASTPNAWAFLNPTMMEEFLANPENEGSTAIVEDFHKINDVCSNGAYLLYRAFDTYSIDCDRDENEMDMRAAIEWLVRAGRESGNAIILIPALGGLTAGAFESIFGRKTIAALKRDAEHSLRLDGVDARVVTTRTLEKLEGFDRAAPVLCLYCSEHELAAVQKRGFSVACVMPLDDRTDQWCDRFEAQQLTWQATD